MYSEDLIVPLEGTHKAEDSQCYFRLSLVLYVVVHLTVALHALYTVEISPNGILGKVVN